MKLHHFNIYDQFVRSDSRIILIPELSETVDDEIFMSSIAQKIISRFGSESIDDGEDLILCDKSLIEDMKYTNKYLIFLASNCSSQNINDNYWDNNLKLGELIFLGWTISNYSSGDYAATDGVFPIICDDLQADEYQMLRIIDADSLNEWGLIKSELVCNKYIEINRREGNRVNDDDMQQEPITDWQAFGVYCDKYTYNKLITLHDQSV